MTMKSTLLKAILFVAAVSLVACNLTEDDASHSGQLSGPLKATGLALTSDTLAGTDIEQMNFEIQPVQCSDGLPVGAATSRTIDYEEMYLPGGIAAFEDEPYDADSQHMFADSYFLVDAGCYDVKTQPMRSATQVSNDCEPADKSGVRVRDGETTEILLVNQCKGAERGGLDVAGSINHPPEIDDLTFEDSKFISACVPRTRVCLTASDPDSDPLEFEFHARNNAAQVGSITPDGTPTFDASTGQWTACAFVDTTDKGSYSFEARVFDLDGNGTRIETLLQQQYPNGSRQSRDTLTFPIHAGVSCPVAGTDAGAPDTGQPDSGQPDSGQPDSGQPDSGQPDAGMPDVADDAGAVDCDCKSAVSLLSYDLERNGQQSQVSSLGSVQSADEVTANFTVDSGCNPIELSFAAYRASASTWSNSIPQTLDNFDTGSFGPGTHSLGPIDIPACFFQVDLVCGPVLSGTQINSGTYYGSRKLDWENGGTTACLAPQGCTRTRGYWSTHFDSCPVPARRIDWPHPEDENNQLCGQSWLSVVRSSSAGGNPWNQLAAQWIAASLNAASGASMPNAVTDALADAESLLSSNCSLIPAADHAEAIALKDTLDAYNNGITGPGACK